jgi:hypothetical protein
MNSYRAPSRRQVTFVRAVGIVAAAAVLCSGTACSTAPSKSPNDADPKRLTRSAVQLTEPVSRYKTSNSDLRSVEVRVRSSSNEAPTNGKTPSNSLGSTYIVIIFQADTQAHAEQHANEMIAANPPGSTSCTSTGEAEVTCEYTE